MEETPGNAGRRVKGQLHTGSCWPLDGEQAAVAFPCAASRAQAGVRAALGKCCGVFLTAGESVYELFTQPVTRLGQAPCGPYAST
jgi:hypothetical protein